MKKIFSSIVLTFYLVFLFTASGMASELYYIKNANKAVLLPSVQNNFRVSGYTIKNNDPVYGVKESSEVVAILEQSGNDSYYFIDNTTDKNLNKKIKSSIKSMGYNCKKIRDDAMTTSFTQTVSALKKSLSTEVKTYNFNETPKSTNNTNTIYNNNTNSDVWTGYVANIPVGTTFNVYLQSTVNTATAQKGDEVIGILTQNWVYRGYTIASQGSRVIGHVSKANSAGMAQRDGKVKFNFTQLQTDDGRVYQISTEEIEFKVDSEGKVKSNVGKVVGGAALGAVLGLVIGALSGKDGGVGRGAVWGAGTGAVWGAGSAVLEQGSDAEIPMYTEMAIKLTSPLKMVLSN